MACFPTKDRSIVPIFKHVSSLHKLILSTLVFQLQTNQEVLRADMPTNPIEVCFIQETFILLANFIYS